MSNAVYAMLTRQEGLIRAMDTVANNLANSSTTGFKSERPIFTEFLVSTGEDTTLSMGGMGAHAFDLEQGALKPTGGKLDLALQGEGFFALDTPQGQRLTRAGHFQLTPDGTITDAFGNPLLSSGGAPLTIPPETSSLNIAPDGTLTADGQIIGSVGVFVANGEMQRDSGTYFSSPAGISESPEARMVQGALEQSNVSPVLEFSRMIEVQRAYEAGQTLMEQVDQRQQQLIEAVRQG